MIELKPDTYYKLTEGKLETYFKVTKEALQSDSFKKDGDLECKDVITKDTRKVYTNPATYTYDQSLFILKSELLNVDDGESTLKEISYKDYLQELKVLKSELDYNYEELIRQSIRGVLDKGGEK
jgi:hypothetical protein